MLRVGVDIGGTHTDLVMIDEARGAIMVHKIPTTVADPSAGTVEALVELCGMAGVDTSATFCCVQCRLLQRPATACAECGSPTTAPVELVRELLYYRDMSLVGHREWGLVAAFLAGSSFALPIASK